MKIILASLRGADLKPAGHGKVKGRRHTIDKQKLCTEPERVEIAVREMFETDRWLRTSSREVSNECGCTVCMASLVLAKMAESGALQREWNQTKRRYVYFIAREAVNKPVENLWKTCLLLRSD